MLKKSTVLTARLDERGTPRPTLARRGTWLLLCGLFGLLLLPATGRAQCTQLVWADEFNGTAVDTTKWKFIVGDGCPSQCNFGNSELQNYRAQNASVAGGSLIITTRNEVTKVGTRTYQYTSAKLQSKQPGSGQLQTFKYGRFEARIKLPSAGGIWPAFWMLADPNNWPNTGEIDILEAKHKNPDYVTGTAIGHNPAGGTFYASRRSPVVPGVDLSAGFHEYAVEWGPDVLRFYLDGTLYNTVTPATTPGGAFPFNENRFYLILNAAVGGPNTAYTGKIAPTPADYPAQMEVDYVRVYSGAYNYAVIGDDRVFQNETAKNYRLDPVAGATYAWTVPAGATIVNGQGTNTITVNWGSAGGDVTVTAAVAGCPTSTHLKTVAITAPLQVDEVLEDYEANRKLTYTTVSGTLTQAVANPAPAAPNTSALVGQYARNATQQYDVLYVRNFTISNANDFVTGRKKAYLDVYSTAPVGSRVTMQLENSLKTTSTNYPTGRHSAYKAYTSRQNAWETLEFTYESTPDPATSVLSIDNVVFMFEPGKNSGSTYYLDNLLVRKLPARPVAATAVLEDYDGTSRISVDAAITAGTYTPGVSNPAPAAPNTSATVAQYVRNGTQQYDGLFFNATPQGTVITDAGKFKSQTYQLQFDLYTDAPVGTPISVNLQNKSAAAKAYPSGRNSVYLATTTKQNQWERITLVYGNSPDAASSNLTIDQLALLFNSNTLTANTYYIDNLQVVKYVPDPTYSAGTVLEDYEGNHAITYQSSDGTYQAPLANSLAGTANASANLGRYDRKATATYDALVFNTSAITDGAAFKAGSKVFAVDLYTTAAPGTLISCQLESSALTTASNYPTGRHSIYQAVVKQANAWQTLYFTYASTPDPGTTDANVDHLLFLFAPNSSTSDTYYLDNVRTLNVTNPAPAVSLTSPTAGATATAPASLTLSATASDPDGFISKVEFFNGTTLLGTATASPYAYTWSGVPAGTYSLTAKATDNNGAASTSAAVSVTVNPDPATAVNLALLKRAVASSVESNSITYRAAKAVDGNATTRWSSVAADNQWIYVDLGATYNVNRVKLTWQNSRGKNFNVEIAADSVNWTPLRTVTNNSALVNDYTGLTGTGRFIRINCLTRYTTFGFSLFELEVYGTRATGARPLATASAGKVAGAVYPNPAAEQLTVELAGLGAHTLTLSDMRGAVVQHLAVDAGTSARQLDLRGLARGIYVLSIRSADGVEMKRIVKE